MLYVEELCAGSDLLTYVRKRRRLKEPVAKFILKQILDGLYYCHSKGILHRDIKLDNILLNGEGDIKICDFGVSKMINPGERMMEQCGTPAYIAPEILKNKGYEGFGVDIWSAGVVLHAMIYGAVPFRANNMSELHKIIIKGEYELKEDVSEEVRDLLTKMLEVDPKKRYDIPKILCHQWFNDYDPSITLFTKEEKAAIAKEFTYSKKHNKNKELDNVTMESDWFIEQNIDLTNTELVKNITTKSAILAPFNSTITNEDERKDYEIREEEVKSKRLVKLSSKVKEIDRQYERNNNCEVDNGVYNKVNTKKDKNNLDPLENVLMCNDPFEGGDSPKMKSVKKVKKSPSPVLSGAMKSNLLNSLIPKPLIINKRIVKKVVDLGYPEDYIIESLEKGLKNYATTTYFLLS